MIALLIWRIDSHCYALWTHSRHPAATACRWKRFDMSLWITTNFEIWNLMKKRKVTIKSLCLWGCRFWLTLIQKQENGIIHLEQKIFCCSSFAFCFFILVVIHCMQIMVKLTNLPFSLPKSHRKEPRQLRQKSRGWPPVKAELAHGRTWCR